MLRAPCDSFVTSTVSVDAGAVQPPPGVGATGGADAAAGMAGTTTGTTAAGTTDALGTGDAAGGTGAAGVGVGTASIVFSITLPVTRIPVLTAAPVTEMAALAAAPATLAAAPTADVTAQAPSRTLASRASTSTAEGRIRRERVDQVIRNIVDAAADQARDKTMTGLQGPQFVAGLSTLSRIGHSGLRQCAQRGHGAAVPRPGPKEFE
jgi:hypothetical protein